MHTNRVQAMLCPARPMQTSWLARILKRFSSQQLTPLNKASKQRHSRLVRCEQYRLFSCFRKESCCDYFGHIRANKYLLGGRSMCGIVNPNRICWSCNKKLGAEIFFCDLCKKIQPPLNELSFFQIFGSTQTYNVSVQDISIRYRELQSMIHPDKFGNSLEEERHYSAEQSALINKAYNILIDPLSRAVYLLALNGTEIGEENTVAETDFLMEVMEINERLSEVKTLKDLDNIRKINNDAIDKCIQNLFLSFEKCDFTAAKEWTIKFRYYRNILEIVKEKTLEIEQ